MFTFTKYAEKKFKKLPNQVKTTIVLKLKNIGRKQISGNFCKLHNFDPATHRLRIGDYRLILKADRIGWIVLDVGHRRSIYK